MTKHPLTGQILEITDERWMRFVNTASGACTFHHPAWVSVLQRSYGFRPFVMAICESDDTICAGIPVMEVKNPLSAPRWISLPFSDHCAPLFENADSLKALTDFLHASLQDDGPASLELRFPYPRDSHFYSKELYVLHHLQLSGDVDEDLGNIHSMHRRNAKKARKYGLEIRSGVGLSELKEFYRLHLETRRYQGMPVQPWSFFEALRELVLEQGLGFILLAYKDQACLAAAMFLHWGDTLIYKYGASSKDGLSMRPNDLLFMEAIRWGSENGYSHLDFGRTDFQNTGLREFKSRWGAEETQLVYSFSAPVPDAEEGHLMNFAHNVIRHSPLWVSRLSGELFYRYFG